jgi:hypothetical protein
MSPRSFFGRMVRTAAIGLTALGGTLLLRQVAPHIERLLRRLFPAPPPPPFLPPAAELLVVDISTRAVIGFPILGGGTVDTQSVRIIQGTQTGIDNPIDIAVDPQRRICVVNLGGNLPPTTLVWESDANGDQAPRWTIPHPSFPFPHPFRRPTSVTFRTTPRRILLTTSHPDEDPAVVEYRIDSVETPAGRLAGSQTGLLAATSIATSPTEFFVADPLAPAVRVYHAITAQNANVVPVRVISGTFTLLRNPYRLAYHAPGDLLFVLDNERTLPRQASVHIFAGTALPCPSRTH